MDKHLHIISLDVPFPADYGGVMDIFHKIVSLHKEGVKIHLHCFSKGRVESDELNKYCHSVDYYPRKKISSGIALLLPHIVSSRTSDALLKNLQNDDHPIFFEGVHCTYLIHQGALKGRKFFVRLHNVEFTYYKKLAKHEKNLIRKAYFHIESLLLKRYERKIANKATFWPLSETDTEVYKTIFGAKKIDYLPVFLPWDEVEIPHGKGCFCLYQGNLSINENEKAAEWLLTEVFDTISIPLVIAGKNPSARLEALSHQNKNTCIISNPSDKEMQDLIKKAQVNIIPSFNSTGVKLKLLNALYTGRHCLVNNAAIEGMGLENLCHISESAASFKIAATDLYEQLFKEDYAVHRKEVLDANYNNRKNALQLIEWIF